MGIYFGKSCSEFLHLIQDVSAFVLGVFVLSDITTSVRGTCGVLSKVIAHALRL